MNRRVKKPTAGARTKAAAAVLVAATVALCTGTPATADTAPTDPSRPADADDRAADALPTAQMDGVGLTQAIIGTTVYVGGTFSTARPAGAEAGSGTVRRRNLLAYDLATGELNTGFHPSLNGTVLSVVPSPDRTRLYVGGYFTRVNGVRVQRIVALNPVTGRIIRRFKVTADRPVRAIAAQGRTVWFGGDFGVVNRRQRAHAARVRAGNGSLLGWAPHVTGGPVTAMVVAPDRGSVVLGGRFTQVNGSRRYGYGLARVGSAGGKTMVFQAARVVRNGGKSAGITSLVSDGERVWGAGFVAGGRGGNLEGSFAANWSTGRLTWLEDCHGDTYSIYPAAKVVYAVGHPHNCANIGGFPDSQPKIYHYALAFSKAVTQVVAPEPAGSQYSSFEGKPAPTLQTWFPAFDIGSTTTARQGPWHITGRGKYLAVAGEFMHVNGKEQQGLVRFATRDVAPNLQKPLYSNFEPSLTSANPGEVTVSWTALWDRDNANLDYEVHRIGTGLIGRSSGASSFWSRPTMSVTDTGLVSGTTYRYEVRAIDPFGNMSASQRVSITVP